VADADVLRLYDFVYNNLADVKKALFQIRSTEDTQELGKTRAALLSTMTTQLGSTARNQMTSDQEKLPSRTAPVAFGDYHEFMERSKGRNIDGFKSAGIFYLAGMSKVFLPVLAYRQANRPVFCFVKRRFDFHNIDLELFTYYICHVFAPVDWA
jgi:hypothetical protein